MTEMTPEQDRMYMDLARAARADSTCRKKKLGCILVMPLRGYAYVQGTNGPPFPLKPCDPGCPRSSTPSGQNLGICRAVHAERQALLKVAKYGLCTEQSILYSDTGIPCKECLLEMIQAGVSELVCTEEAYYDELSRDVLSEWIRAGGRFRIYKEEGRG